METLLKESYNEIVFDKRNKNFGAYSLRRKYSKRVIIAFGISISIFALALASPIIYNIFKQEEEVVETEMVVAQMMNVEEVAEPKQEEIKKPEPLKESIKFPPLEIKPDELVKAEEEVASEEELKESNPGSETHEGEKGHSNEESAKTEPPPVTEPVKIEDNNVYEWVEQLAEFPGGESALRDYLKDHTTYPQEAYDKNIQGTAFVEFTINKDGTLSDFKIAKSSGNELLDEAALKSARTLPRFKPATMNGELKRTKKKVRFPFILK